LCSKSENGQPRPPSREIFNRTSRASADETRLRFLIRKDQFCFKHIRDLCGQAQITTGMLSMPKPTMGSGSLPNRASLLGETGYASSSQCQIGSKPARDTPAPDIRPRRAALRSPHRRS